MTLALPVDPTSLKSTQVVKKTEKLLKTMKLKLRTKIQYDYSANNEDLDPYLPFNVTPEDLWPLSWPYKLEVHAGDQENCKIKNETKIEKKNVNVKLLVLTCPSTYALMNFDLPPDLTSSRSTREVKEAQKGQKYNPVPSGRSQTSSPPHFLPLPRCPRAS